MMPTRPPERILIIKPSSLGDIVHSLPVLAALRDAYPRAHIAWLVSTSFAPLLDGLPALNEVIPFDRRHFGQMLRRPRVALEFMQFVRTIRERRFDLVIDLQGLIRSGFLAWASGAKTRFGFAAARELAWLFYTQRVRCSRSAVHAVDRNLCVAAALGLSIASPSFPLHIRDDERSSAIAMLSKAAGGSLGAFTAILPGARWKTKLWATDRWAELIDRLAAAGLPRAVLLGAMDERPLADAIVGAARASPVDLVGRTTLRQLVAILSLADRVASHDSGPLHIAAALGKPLVAIFGPTDPSRCGPFPPGGTEAPDGGNTARVVATAIDCSPCYRRTCWHHSCMQWLPVEAVLTPLGSLRTADFPPLPQQHIA